jgi:hypothetical protein
MTDVAEQVERLDMLIGLATNETRPKLRQNQTRAVLAQATKLAAIWDELSDKLSGQWEWLDAHPEDPRAAKREDQCLSTLRAYETACKALQRVTEGVLTR